MFSGLLDRLGASPRVTTHTEALRASSSDSVRSAVTVEASANAQSSSSTPPTSIDDGASVASASLPIEKTEDAQAEPSEGRSKRNRTSVGTYNIKILAGTAVHTPQKYVKDKTVGAIARRRRTFGDAPLDSFQSAQPSANNAEQDAGADSDTDMDVVSNGVDALDSPKPVKAVRKCKSHQKFKSSPKKTVKEQKVARRKSAKAIDMQLESIGKRLGVLGKRDRKEFEEQMAGLTKAKRELKNLADTAEFAKIETKPVIHEIWSKGKLVTGEPIQKKQKVQEPSAPPGKVDENKTLSDQEPIASSSHAPQVEKPKLPKTKIYLDKGLYAGQESRNLNWFAHDSVETKRDMELVAPYKPNAFFPLPMWHGQRLLQTGRDFRLPFDICSPLPPGQPKPDEWRKTSSNRFIGEAGTLWKKSPLFQSFSSKCMCKPEYGCDEDCQNKIMFYECDDTNCGAGRSRCSNRAFADLIERRKLGGKYRIGVEVIKTADRGYGVRSNRCFDPNQIIVEYTGEIITEDECDRRMNEDYKNNECYYLMSFDQRMIIDGTKGSIARFVNHSCKPNCKMVKWIVGGKPRMALFAGDNPIMSGDELTYDYNFDPFSAKNVQECRCGSDNCRGFLGPKPKPVKEIRPLKESIKDVVKAGKRKIKELLGQAVSEDEDDIPSPKKRKIQEAKSVGMRMTTGVKAVRQTVSSSILGASGSKQETVIVRRKYKKRALKIKTGKGQTKRGRPRKTPLRVESGESSPESVSFPHFEKLLARAESIVPGGETINVVACPEDPDETEVENEDYEDY